MATIVWTGALSAVLAVLQDFPAGFEFEGNKTERARQIGNACPRTLARLLATANAPR